MKASTTAQARKAAHDAEKALEWSKAAVLYEVAAMIHPGRSNPKGLGDLNKRDIAQLESRAKACRHMAKQEGQPEFEGPEFTLGQEVTFHPYEKALKAKVVGLEIPGTEWWQPEGWRYHLTGNSVLTRTSGLSIEESKHFKPYDGNWAA